MGFSAIERLGNFAGPTPHGFTWGLVLLKDLSKTSNTGRYFHAQIKVERWTILTRTL
jgi:hypothetical protein